MKKNYPWLAIALFIVIAGRLITMFIFNNDPAFLLSPRNFNVRGMLIMPHWIDFLLPFSTILIFYRKKHFSFRKKMFLKILLVSAPLLLIPIISGLLLSNYYRQLWFTPELGLLNFLHYIYFILSFYAIQLFADQLSDKRKIIKYLLTGLYVLFLAVLQDVFISGGLAFSLIGILSSPGTFAALLAWVVRPYYKNYPAESLAAAAILGFFVHFIIINVISFSYFTLFVPFIAMILTVIAILSVKNRWIMISLLMFPLVLALFLNFVLPQIVSPELKAELVEHKEISHYITEKVGSVTVKFPEEKYRAISMQMAKVIDEANKLSLRTFGVSPQVKELEILGIGSGGFHAEFPNRIVGKLISEKYIRNCSDSLFLNNPDLPVAFPDPVNAILHEFSHLYGSVPYYKWLPGSEEEGWATFSATVLSKLLYQIPGGENLWTPAYNFARQAEKITLLNLSGKAVVWSHPDEYGGFQLWHSLAKEIGIKTLYLKRWQVSRHDLKVMNYYTSDPAAAKNVAQTFGIKRFTNYGMQPKVRLGDIYTLADYLQLADLTGMNSERIKSYFMLLSNKIINPAVPVP